MTTLAALAVAAGLLVWWLAHGARDANLGALAIALAASAIMAWGLRNPALQAALSLLGLTLAGALYVAYMRSDCGRSLAICMIETAKLAARVAYLIGPYTSHWVFAAAINLALVVQIIIAGGALDELGRRVDDFCFRHAPRRWGLLRHGAA